MITNNEVRVIAGSLDVPREKYTVTDGNLIKIVRQQLIKAYSNRETSVVREYAVNGRDAMKLRGIDTPIEVYTPSALSPKLSIRDYGGGMTEEETRTLLFSFGASGKEKQISNRYVGGFGIGSKSGFNLSDAFLFTVFYQGTATRWECRLDEEDFPTAAKLSSLPTDEKDGVLVEIPCKPFEEEKALSALKWLDVPVKLNGRPVEPYKSRSQMSGKTTIKDLKGGDLEINWDIVPEYGSGGIVFLVGCGAVYVNTYRAPAEVMKDVHIPNYFSGRFVIELPIGSVTLMASREDFTHDAPTNHVLCEAMKACVDSAHDKIMKTVYEAGTTRDLIDRLAGLRETYDSSGFSTIAGSCAKKLRELTNLDEFKAELCRELELTPENGIGTLFISVPAQSGRGYSNVFRYKTTNATEKFFEGNFHSIGGGLCIWRAKPGEQWRDSFMYEFDALAENGTKRPARVFAAMPRSDTAKNVTKRIVFEALKWDNMEIRVYPGNAKKIIGHVRECIKAKSLSGVTKNSPIVLSVFGDVPKILETVRKLFPGAKIVDRSDIDTFKQRSAVSGRPPVNRRAPKRLLGWLASFASREVAPEDDPDKIVLGMLMRYRTSVTLSSKTSFKDFENSKKPLFCVDRPSSNAWDDDQVRHWLRHIATNLILSKADVAKSENGLPLIAVLDPSVLEAQDSGIPFINGHELEKKYGEVDSSTRNRFALWLYRLLCGDRHVYTYNDQAVLDGSSYAMQTGLKTYGDMPAKLKCAAGLLERIAKELSGRRLHPEIKEAVKTLKLLCTRPEKIPFVNHPGFTAEFSANGSKYDRALRTLVGRSPLANTYLEKLNPYDVRGNGAALDRAAKEIAFLIVERSKTMPVKGERKEETGDNRQ